MATWRIFKAQDDAAAYELACWLKVLDAHAEAGDGTLKDVQTGEKATLDVLLAVDAATLDALSTADTKPDPAVAQAVRAKLDSIPLLGYRDGKLNSEDGYTLRWDVPRLTKAGTWAVQCPDSDKGDPEPVWPDPPPLASPERVVLDGPVERVP